jgi:endonuclease YncB( thermonuclease family)
MISALMLTLAPISTCSTVAVHDGDTIRCDGERVRISNIDAPELAYSPRCDPRHMRAGKNPSWCDDALGLRSRDALQAFVISGTVAIHRQGSDRYGRTLARLTVNGSDAGAYLIHLGLARAWVK